jgi:hypothetical protein
MKAKGFTLFLFCIISLCSALTIKAQTLTETEVYTAEGTEPLDLYSFISDPRTGAYIYVKYDATDNKYTIVSSKGSTSAKLGYVTPGYTRFDSKGNYYTMAVDYVDTSRTDYHLIVNGENIKTYSYAEPYNMLMNSNDQIEFIVKEGDMYKLVKYSAGGPINESESYASIKPIIAYQMMMTEGDDESAPSAEQFFRDKEGRHGYIVSNGTVSSIMFGESITPTKYTDIDQYSFTYDKSGVLSYIAKYGGRFYEVPGREFVVQGDKEYSEFEYVASPLQFTSNNVPVYVTTRKVTDTKYVYGVAAGNEIQKVYKDKAKTRPGDEFTGGIYEVKIDGNNIVYTASIMLNNPPDDYESAMMKTSIVTNGIQGKAYYDMGQVKGTPNKYLASYRDGKKSKDYSLLFRNGSSSEKVNGDAFNSISDYGFDPSGKIYYVGVNYGDYEKKIKDSYSVYLDGERVGTYDGLIYQMSPKGEYSFFKFGKNGKYALIANDVNYEVTSEVSYYNTTYIILNGNVVKPQVSGLKGFEFIDNLNFTNDNRLFYVGGTYDEASLTNNMYLMVDGRPLDKTYNSIQDLKFDEGTNTVTFRGSRGNTIYDVSVKL